MWILIVLNQGGVEASSLTQTTIFEDTFLNGTRYSNSEGSTGTTLNWRGLAPTDGGSGNTYTFTSNDSVFGKSAMKITPAGASVRSSLVNFGAITIGEGESISMSMNFRLDSSPGAGTAYGFRFWLGNSNGTYITSDNLGSSNSIVNDDAGFFGRLSIGTASTSADIYYDSVSSSSASITGATFIESNTTFGAITDTLAHTVSLSIQNQGSNLYVVTFSVSGLGSVSDTITISDSIASTFDQLLIQTTSTSAAYWITDVNIVYSAIPENSMIAFLLVGVAVAMVVTGYRRGKRFDFRFQG